MNFDDQLKEYFNSTAQADTGLSENKKDDIMALAKASCERQTVKTRPVSLKKYVPYATAAMLLLAVVPFLPMVGGTDGNIAKNQPVKETPIQPVQTISPDTFHNQVAEDEAIQATRDIISEKITPPQYHNLEEANPSYPVNLVNEEEEQGIVIHIPEIETAP